MTTKRFILMMLVMLGSVTGAWAFQLESFNYYVQYNGYNKAEVLASCADMSNKFFRVVLSSGVDLFGVSGEGGIHIHPSDADWVWGYVSARNFTVTNKDASHVTIEDIIVTLKDNIAAVHFSYPNGNSEATFQLTSDNSQPKLRKITIYYTSNHEHAMTEWRHNDNVHWQECVGEGVCTEDDNHHFNQANHTYSDNPKQGPAYYTCTTCGYVNEQRKHQHVANDEWSTDANQHWHACLGTVGQCDANGKLDIANHTYGSSMYGEDASVYYACAVCGYVNNTRKAQYDALDFLSMKALDAPMTIGMTKTGSPADYDLQYSLDRTHWTTVALTATNSNIVEIPAGQTCYFRHGSATAIDKISSNQSNHWSFTMTGDGTIEADGNIISLIDATCQKNTLAGSPQHVFTGLFKGCDKLTKAPELPFMSLSQFCYMNMFEGTGISVAPELPATTIPDGAYMGMFRNCRNLMTVSPLPATSLSRRAYDSMFFGCENLTSVEIANITSMDQRTDASNACFTNWLERTAADTNGKVIAPIEMMGHSLIFLPSNWQWATKLKANEDPDNDGNFYTTFYNSHYAYTLPEGVKAYTSTIEEEYGNKVVVLTAIEGNILPKGEAVLLHSNTTGDMLMTISSENGNEPAMNLFRGVDVDTDQGGSTYYMLSYGWDGLGFYKMNEGMMLSANKAFLPAAPAMANVRAFRMVFEDEETGIENINDDDTLRYDNDNIYSVSGIRLNKLQKGINIVNGKKIIVK